MSVIEDVEKVWNDNTVVVDRPTNGAPTRTWAIIGGTWDLNGGKPSGWVAKFHESLKSFANIKGIHIVCLNGGSYEEIQKISGNLGSFERNSNTNIEVLFWFANIPNELVKCRNLKEMYPEKLIVFSKRNTGGTEYDEKTLIGKALELKSNLLFVFDNSQIGVINTRVIDPLGNEWANSTIIDEITIQTGNRLLELTKITRQRTTRIVDHEPFDYDINWQFVDYIKQYGDVYHKLMGIDTTRHLGNASFRCIFGFPSMRVTQNGILVSRRNVPKGSFTQDDFVPVVYDGYDIQYFGETKPSVDTPIQVRLYAELPEVNFMLHSHCYIDGAPFTKKRLPCGAVEEVPEILKLRKHKYINLLGHGSIVLAKSIDELEGIPYIARPLPEVVN